MDEGTLNDLLECSVCLDRLDTSSKVLPCQHTFCKKCLDEIVQKHKELRCPECRVLVQIKVEDLPPNVLLMRILEGMRNAIPKKVHRSNRGSPNLTPAPIVNTTPIHQQHGTPDHRINSNKQNSLHLIPHQPYAKAMYDYASKEAGDLSFKRGDIIILRKRIDSHWYQGECAGKQGVFPLSYVQVITPLPSHIPQCKALYDFRMTNDEEEGCLAFNKNDIINVIRRVDENWAEGKLDGRIGIFPLAFVEMNNLARSLMKLSSNAQPGPSRLAPPTPTTEDSSPLILTDHSRNVVTQQQIPQTVVPHSQASVQQGNLVTSDSSSTVSSGSSSTTTPNISSSNTSSTSSTAPSSPASPPPRSQPLPPKNIAQKPDILLNSNKCSTPQRSPQPQNSHSLDGHSSSHQQNKEKRHSFTSLTPAHHGSTNHNRHSAEIVASEAHNNSSSHSQPPERNRRNGHPQGVPELVLPATYIALYAYKPQKPDELELRKGGIYMVTERCQDGWFKGTSNRTQKCGVFPGNYVTLARGGPNLHSSSSKDGSGDSKLPVSFTRSGKGVSSSRTACNPPELPPRSISPATTGNTISSSWHGQQDNAAVPLGRSSSAIMSCVNNAHITVGSATIAKASDKSKERKEKGTVSLMRRLTSMKRSKSPPPCSYSMDNPVFEDGSLGVPKSAPAHPVHVRTVENPAGSSGSSPDIHRHRKSNSLDAGNKPKTGVQTVRERFRCIAPYPPNSEYELELQVNDIIYVHKKRDDGWYKGTQQRTGRTGLFPASFVESY
ncbi:E3 ubiquitin-protein ligase SH3RF1 isoform X2 [Anoplophora glabripennis]|uniref:E3 ubiquitin-protein ligase SH3RF1 isoform X2 n=1 Tax=Anoplophora glabripennis TaxID=217634 RepID=UPI000873F883|nr:E3 ubiquitin-protein ligase SH3RF1 isoform X2 [Anoplophora glabripennis]